MACFGALRSTVKGLHFCPAGYADYDVTATEFDAAISLLYASRSYLPLKVRVFVTFVTELFRNGPPWEAVLR
jgi:hypothetical protein